MSDDDGWSDEEVAVDNTPEIIGVYIVTRDCFPTTNGKTICGMCDSSRQVQEDYYLTLEQDNLVYVFSKDPKVSGKEGYWRGETRGVTGIFDASFVRERVESELKKK